MAEIRRFCGRKCVSSVSWSLRLELEAKIDAKENGVLEKEPGWALKVDIDGW